jgi:dipeptidase E
VKGASGSRCRKADGLAGEARHIVAIGGGEFSGETPSFEGYIVSLVEASRPKVCFVPTASGDNAMYIARFYEVFPSRSFVPSVLTLFGRTVADVASFLAEQHVIFVGGGNTANMLAVWRLHGVDVALEEAWNAGVVLAGSSAGANCWFQASTTDSFLLGTAEPLNDGLGLLEGSFCPHYDSEPARPMGFRKLVGSRELPEGIACDDLAAVHFAGTEMAQVVSTSAGSGAYRVARRADGGIEETPLDVTRL